MTPETLTSALVDFLDADRVAHAADWPVEATVSRDPRFYFEDAVKAPAVRLGVDPGGEVRTKLGERDQQTVKVFVGYARRVETLAEFDAACVWARRLMQLLDDVERIGGVTYSHNRSCAWVYLYDETAIQTSSDGTSLVGEFVGLFETTWVGVSR